MPRARPRVKFFVVPAGLQHFALAIDGEPMLTIANDGRLATIEPAAASIVYLQDLVRWGAPLGLAPQGITCLHGSAVQTPGGLVIILGVGGSGKSTLAALLDRHGLPAVLDDLVVCDEAGNVDLLAEGVVRSWSAVAAEAPGGHVAYAALASELAGARHQWCPVALVVLLGNRLAFPGLDLDMATSTDSRLNESAGRELTFSIETLRPFDAVVAINEHRFGSHPSPAAWVPQFTAVTAIVDHAPVAVLREPDGLESLEAAGAELAAALLRRVQEARPYGIRTQWSE